MARTSVRSLWAQKLAGTLPQRAVAAPIAGSRIPFEGVVLGIDPSLRATGLALVAFARGRQPVLLHSRTVAIPASVPMAHALGRIATQVRQVLEQGPVRHVAIEQTIYVQNFQTAQILGAARGAALSVPGALDMPVFEYPPLRVKQAVVGVGRASKEQMARTVMALLGHGATLSFDEADAAGTALCHAFTWRE
ncbi:crossover junction endodeoxyribonuclease RuvC [Nibricoccus sp. IMCC34717]|uniref:crossover junction endodeoxyribonuclease RuvC n=1 Tax=Nibricoccus sp. IMCC34717 TaxID=3034021 RepID=UPI003851672A